MFGEEYKLKLFIRGIKPHLNPDQSEISRRHYNLITVGDDEIGTVCRTNGSEEECI
jgi:hypothetical protein